ncbi:hypothetical protein [Leminorella richardii]
MAEQNLHSVENFDFLARSLAQMYTQGRPVNVHAVIGNMNEVQKAWFQKRYARYLEQAEQAKVSRTEH